MKEPKLKSDGLVLIDMYQKAEEHLMMGDRYEIAATLHQIMVAKHTSECSSRRCRSNNAEGEKNINHLKPVTAGRHLSRFHKEESKE